MKPYCLPLLRPIIFVFVILTVFNSCKKDPPKKKFEVKTKTWYRVAPTAPAAIEINGEQFVASAFFPGGGAGTATHMGTVSYYFNQLTYAVSAGAPPAGSVAAPLVDVISYPVTGAPLPLIQQGDFAGLSSLQNSLHVPSEVQGLTINAIIVAKNLDAVFTSAITGSGTTFPISATRIGFNGKAYIAGGRGKFQRAFGEINYEGWFDVTDPNNAEYNAEGWISY